MNANQINQKQADAAYKSASEYERTADRKAWNFYPCDDHVIRAQKRSDGMWSAVLTMMVDRKTLVLYPTTGRTRAAAVRSMLLQMRSHIAKA